MAHTCSSYGRTRFRVAAAQYRWHDTLPQATLLKQGTHRRAPHRPDDGRRHAGSIGAQSCQARKELSRRAPSRRPPTRQRLRPRVAALPRARRDGRLRGRSSDPARTSAGYLSGSCRTRSRMPQARAGQCSALARRTGSRISASPAPAEASRDVLLVLSLLASQLVKV